MGETVEREELIKLFRIQNNFLITSVQQRGEHTKKLFGPLKNIKMYGFCVGVETGSDIDVENEKVWP